ncbi:MAG: hypothetical protein P8O87_09340 [Crocinitomicaceae bacterium]|nr:hypothetical protein [Crocinitomicaceae bacterium]
MMSYRFIGITAILVVLGLHSCSPKTLPTGEVNYERSTDTGLITLTSTGYYKGTHNDALREAEEQAFETILFRGVPGSQIPNPMLGTDEVEIKAKNQSYFNEFYGNRRCRTFITSSNEMGSSSKQGFKSVTVQLIINFKTLRKDLEAKGLKRGFGL